MAGPMKMLVVFLKSWHWFHILFFSLYHLISTLFELRGPISEFVLSVIALWDFFTPFFFENKILTIYPTENFQERKIFQT